MIAGPPVQWYPQAVTLGGHRTDIGAYAARDRATTDLEPKLLERSLDDRVEVELQNRGSVPVRAPDALGEVNGVLHVSCVVATFSPCVQPDRPISRAPRAGPGVTSAWDRWLWGSAPPLWVECRSAQRLGDQRHGRGLRVTEAATG